MNPDPQQDCPHCGKDALIRDEVDIGVGTQYGPWHCQACGYSDDEDSLDMLRGLGEVWD